MLVFCMSLRNFVLPLMITRAIVLECCAGTYRNKTSDGQNDSEADRSNYILISTGVADEYSTAKISCSMTRTEQRISDEGYIIEDGRI